MHIVSELSGDHSLVISVETPAAGIWELEVGSAVDLSEQTVYTATSLYDPLEQPVISVSMVDGRTVELNYQADSDAFDLEIALYYDDDASGYDGVMITADIAESADGHYTWIAEDDLPKGDYYFYLAVSDPDHTPVLSEYTSVAAISGNKADLFADDLTLSVPSVMIGDSITIEWTVSNLGDVASSATTCLVVLSNNAQISAADTILATVNIASLDAGGDVVKSIEAAIPESFVLSDDCYIGIIVDPANTENEGDGELNNIMSQTVEIIPLDITAPTDPENLTIDITGNSVELDWDDSTDDISGVKEYVIEYANNAQFTSATSQTAAVSELDLTSLADGNYYWHVKAVDNKDNESTWVEGDMIVIDTTAPDVPTGLSLQTNGNDLTYDWADSSDNVTGVKEYVVELATLSDFSNALSTVVAESIFTLDDLADGNYYIRVKAIDNNNNESAWTNGSMFAVDATAPSVPTGLYSDGNGGNISLDWNNATDNLFGVSGYVVEYTQTPGFTTDVYSLNTADSQLDLNGLAYGTWLWRVAAVDGAGNQSDWSALNSFDTGDTAGNSFAEARGFDVTATHNNDEYVGLGDACDMYCFEVAEAGEFNLTLTGLEAKTMLCLYEYDLAKDSYKKVKSVSAKTDKTTGETSASLDDLLLDAGAYYLEVMSGDKGKGKCNTDYSLEITPDYFPSASVDEFDFKGGAGAPETMDLNPQADSSTSGWVGFGDPQDVYQFEVDSAGEFDFALTDLEAKASLCLYWYDAERDRYQRIRNASAKTDKVTGENIASFNNILLESGTYYLEVLSGDKGKGKCNTDYTLEIEGDYFPEPTADNTWENAELVDPDVSIEGFVGFGDACDCYKFEVDSLTSFDFDLAGEDRNAKLTIYQWMKQMKGLRKSPTAA